MITFNVQKDCLVVLYLSLNRYQTGQCMKYKFKSMIIKYTYALSFMKNQAYILAYSSGTEWLVLCKLWISSFSSVQSWPFFKFQAPAQILPPLVSFAGTLHIFDYHSINFFQRIPLNLYLDKCFSIYVLFLSQIKGYILAIQKPCVLHSLRHIISQGLAWRKVLHKRFSISCKQFDTTWQLQIGENSTRDELWRKPKCIPYSLSYCKQFQ